MSQEKTNKLESAIFVFTSNEAFDCGEQMFEYVVENLKSEVKPNRKIAKSFKSPYRLKMVAQNASRFGCWTINKFIPK